MDTAVSSTAWRIAQRWAYGHDRPYIVISGFARQVQDHLEHQGDPEHLALVATWLSVAHPDCLDLDMGLRYANAPQPGVKARAGHPCPCRGGPTRGGGAPAPAIVRQLIRRSPIERAA